MKKHLIFKSSFGAFLWLLIGLCANLQAQDNIGTVNFDHDSLAKKSYCTAGDCAYYTINIQYPKFLETNYPVLAKTLNNKVKSLLYGQVQDFLQKVDEVYKAEPQKYGKTASTLLGNFEMKSSQDNLLSFKITVKELIPFVMGYPKQHEHTFNYDIIQGSELGEQEVVINDTKQRKQHLAKRKESLIKLCKRYKLNRQDFKRWNGVAANNKIYANQYYYVAPPITRPQYRAQEGDGLYQICRKFEVHVTEFMRWNQLEKTASLLVDKAYHISPPLTTEIVEKPQVAAVDPKDKVEDVKDEQKVKTYKARRGDTVSEICVKFNISTADFRRWNRLGRRSKIYAGKTYFVQKPTRTIAKSSNGKYKVRRGDTVSEICVRFGISSADFRRWNKLSRKGKIYAGKTYYVAAPDGGKTSTTKEDNTTNKKEKLQKNDEIVVTYIAKTGDTISEICKKHKITEAQFRRWNKLRRNSQLKAGKTYYVFNPED